MKSIKVSYTLGSFPGTIAGTIAGFCVPGMCFNVSCPAKYSFRVSFTTIAPVAYSYSNSSLKSLLEDPPKAKTNFLPSSDK